MVNNLNIFSIWLLSLTLSICMIILIGGYTRISDSGLSITEWLPISGILYPFNDFQWQTEFDKYKRIDEFILVNSAMTLSEFKVIYFWEWFHRFFARLIGILYVIPLVFLYFKNKIKKKYYFKIFLIGALLITQAFIGWYMVSSGLVGRVDVSHYRLALHLTMAFLILALTFNIFIEENFNSFFNLIGQFKNISEKIFFILFILIFIQISYGAFVSGTHSGLLFNTWPLYDGKVFPLIENNELRGIINYFERGEYIIFLHRTLAVLILFFVIYINYLSYNISI